jgi:hypothetical protein
MAETSFPGGATAGETLSFLSEAGGVWSTGLDLPTNRRVANNGDRPILVTRIRAYVSGRFATRSCRLGIDQAGGSRTWTGFFDRAAAGSAQDAGWRTINRLSNNGGEYRVFIEADGSFYFGRAASGGSTNVLGGASGVWGGSLAGEVEWFESPSAPLNPSATDQGGGVVRVEWDAPAATGGTPITGYRILYDSDPAFGSPGVIDVSATSTVRNISGLSVGTTYHVRVYAKNAVTEAAGTYSVASSTVSASTGAVPGAPTSLDITTALGYVALTWSPPASDGGVTIERYDVQYSLNSSFTSPTTVQIPADASRVYTLAGPLEGTAYWMRVRAVNDVGAGAYAAAVSVTTPASDHLNHVWGASVSLPEGGTLALRVATASVPPSIELVHYPFDSSAGVVLGAVSGFSVPGGRLNLDLVIDPAGNAYVIGADATIWSTLRVAFWTRSGPTSWTYEHAMTGALPSTTDSIAAVAAAYVPGVGSNPISSILVLARRFGSRRAGALSFALVDVAAAQTGTGDLFLSSGSNPSWLSSPPSSAPPNSGMLDAAILAPGSTKVALYGDTRAAVDVVNGVITSLSKAPSGTFNEGSQARVIGLDSTRYAVLLGEPAVPGLTYYVWTTSGTQLATGLLDFGDARFGSGDWDAYYDSVARVIRVYYAKSSSAITWCSRDFSVDTYALLPGENTSIDGPALTSIAKLRVPDGIVDERSVLLERAHITTGGVKSKTATTDATGNVPPSAPATTDLSGFDGTAAQNVTWVFGDVNPSDSQRAYQVEVSTLAGAVVYDSGKVVSTAAAHTIPAGTLTNGTTYRWRVRTYDALDVSGTWSAYDQFTVSALGTLTITSPAADNPAGLEVSTYPITWSFVQASGYTQTQRRVRVIRVVDSAVLSDTGMIASTSNSYTVDLPTDEPVRIEVSIVSNAPGSPTIGPSTRLMSTSYGLPMTPVASVDEVADTYVALRVVNPAPTGDRPATVRNVVERRDAAVGGDFSAVGTLEPNGVFYDYTVASGAEYDYRVRAISE